ncbi:MAG TPA: uracil permease [Candidatus Eremiobacteraeota bacterium]|nr:MAG: Uracil permease [bacterium ADurb.Bin363]HPZ06640.1 uracil permease [Candidatus Eremiobacteraeota bacterium]
MERTIIQVEEKVPFLQGLPLSFQHLFAMFGASVLVPFLFNQAARNASGNPELVIIDPSLVLLMNGIGTLLYLFICKGKAPAFLGSSFAFIAPATAVILSSPDYVGNFSKALGGFMVSGLIFMIVASIIGMAGTKWIDVVLPPAAMGPVVALIGLELSETATQMAGFFPDKNGSYNMEAIAISIFTLAVVILGSLLFKGFLSVIPVLIAVLSGYGLSVILNIYHPGIINYSVISEKNWLVIPRMILPSFHVNAILIIIPAALVVMSEHIGHLFVTGNIVGRNLIKDPGLHRSLFSDGISTTLSGLAGSVPTTTYGENMGVMAITGVYSVWVIGGAALISIIMAFFGKLSGVISSIPIPVMGGVSIVLFGVIAASGIRMLVEARVDYSKSRNLILTAVVFVSGISGVTIKLGQVGLSGMALATVVGIILSLIFYGLDKLKLTND